MIRIFLWRVCFEVLHFVRAITGPGQSRVLYFAYGANLDPKVLEHRKIKIFGEKEFVLRDFEFHFSHQSPYRGMGYASVEAKEGILTYGKLYTLSRLDALRLDFFEGRWFIKRYRKLTHMQDSMNFFLYQSYAPREGLLPSKDYLSKIIRGFATLRNVPSQYLDWLKNHDVVDQFTVSDDIGFCIRIRNTWPNFLIKVFRKYDQFVAKVFVRYLRDYSLTIRFIKDDSAKRVQTHSLDIDDRKAIFKLVASIRATAGLQNRSSLEELERRLEPFTAIKPIQAFRGDISRIIAGAKADFASTRQEDLSDTSGILIGFLAAPYNKDLGLECILYDECHIPKEVAKAFPSKARPINVQHYSDGFKSDLAVAVFPENFICAGDVPPDARSFYFIDKFVRRCREKTIPFIRNKTTYRSLLNLKIASNAQLEEAASLWVHLHEHFHCQGVLPLPAALKLKSSRSTASLEELRVDLLALLACRSDVVKRTCNAPLLEEFILAERLFRYGFERCPNEDYDSRGAHIFYRYLEATGAIVESADRIDVDMIKYMKLATRLSMDISALELQIVEKSFAEAKEKLTDYVRDMALYDQTTKLFPQGKFFSFS